LSINGHDSGLLNRDASRQSEELAMAIVLLHFSWAAGSLAMVWLMTKKFQQARRVDSFHDAL